jgi:Tfp pilus assembly protein PilZ
MVQELRCSRYTAFLTHFMVAFPLAYLAFASLIFELNSKGILRVVLSPLFYLASFFWIMTGVGLKRLRKWSWYTFIGAQFFITYLNALNLLEHSESEFKTWAFGFTILIQSYVFLAIRREIRVPYLFPKINWWESGIAGMSNLPVEVTHLGNSKGTTPGQILDLSQKGCFIKTHLDFESFEKVSIHLQAFDQDLELPGIVMWNAKSTVTHPKGIGVRFGDLNRKSKRSLRVVAQKFLRMKDPKDDLRLSQ